MRPRLIFLQSVCRGAGSAQGAASRRRPLYPRALAAKIATSWFLRLIPAGFGSGRGSVLAKHGPQPASMRAAPASRERLSDFEATNTSSFSNHGYNGRDLQLAMARTVGRISVAPSNKITRRPINYRTESGLPLPPQSLLSLIITPTSK